jgi:hypothetical protein
MRSSTLKVHVKTHGDEISSQSSRIKEKKDLEIKIEVVNDKKETAIEPSIEKIAIQDFPVVKIGQDTKVQKPAKVIKFCPTPVKPQPVIKQEGSLMQEPRNRPPFYKRLNSQGFSGDHTFMMYRADGKHFNKNIMKSVKTLTFLFHFF